MKWERLGVVYKPDGSVPWMRSHAYLPTAIVMKDRIRVFAAFRDAQDVGRIGWIDLSADGRFQLLDVSSSPCLDIGKPGTFDDNGVSPMALVNVEGKLRCYYAGWQLTPRVRYLLFTGAAISEDGGRSFVRESEVPVFERSSKELITRSGAFVLRHGKVWKAWYAAGSSTVELKDRSVPTYHLAYMESPDGLYWPSEGTVSILPTPPDEYGFGRPFVEFRDGAFHIWYSVRSFSRGYFIGYATSQDGIKWTRRDEEGGLVASQQGWDSEMVGFAAHIDIPSGRYMFYNGNGYGLTGIGVARLSA